MTENYNTFWESKLSIIITMKRNQHGSKSINNNLQTWPFEPTEESRMFPEKSLIYFRLDVSCLLQSAAMVAKKLLVGAKITACFKQICFCMLLCKFRSEKHIIWWNILLSWKRLLSIFNFRASSNLSIFLRAADWSTTNFLGMYCYFPVIRLVTRWPRLQ